MGFQEDTPPPPTPAGLPSPPSLHKDVLKETHPGLSLFSLIFCTAQGGAVIRAISSPQAHRLIPAAVPKTSHCPTTQATSNLQFRTGSRGPGNGEERELRVG